MIRKLLAVAALVAAVGHAFAAVDVNTANEDALRGIKGIGPGRAKAILDERGAHGPFKSTADLSSRVRGLGGNTVERLQAEGLSVGPAGAGTAGARGAATKQASTQPQTQARTRAPAPARTPAVTVKK